MSSARRFSPHASNRPRSARGQQVHGACRCGHEHGARAGLLGHGRASGVWAGLVPIMACAVCPACVSTYASVLATLGVGVALSERQHLVLLAVAVLVSLALSARRARRSGRLAPLLVAATGCALLSSGHLLQARAAEWSGMAVLVVGGLLEQRAARRVVRGAASGIAA